MSATALTKRPQSMVRTTTRTIVIVMPNGSAPLSRQLNSGRPKLVPDLAA
jgi:hypothetical protein